MAELKQVIIIRKDLKLPKGKSAAQAAHASVEAVLRSDKSMVLKWRNQGMKKIVLTVDDLQSVHKYVQFAKEAGVVSATITDAGRTCVEPGTLTCAAIGPDEEAKVDRITGDLKMY